MDFIPPVFGPLFNPDETYTWEDAAHSGVTKGSTGGFISIADPNSSDYQEFLRWQASGKSATEYLAPIIPVSSQRVALQANLDGYIATLNSKYAGLSLSSSDTLGAATLKLLGVGAEYSDCTNLKMLYDVINSL